MTAPLAVPGWLRRHAAFYRANAALAFKLSVQYRGSQFLGLFALMTEPVVYLVVWTQVAEHNGGTVGGLTIGQVSAYYVVWTLVRNLTGGYAPAVWQRRFQDGSLADWLLRPVHPVHDDLAGGFGFNVPRAALTIPLTIGLVVVFDPDLSPRLLEVAVCVVAIVLAYVLRSLAFTLVGSVGFWTTQVDAASRLYMAAELLLSGRLVPIVLFPAWLATTSEWLPFRYTFGFPIEALAASMSDAELLAGLAIQLGWIVALALLVAWVWRVALRRFDSVGI